MLIAKKLTLLTLLFLISFCYSFAQEREPAPGLEKRALPVRFLIKGALEFGGDEIAEVYFTNGDQQPVKAGQGGSIAIGGEFRIPKVENLLFHATVGYKYVTTIANNAHIRLTRVPIQATANWMATKKLRFGAGLATHQVVRFKADGIGPDMAFKGASGPVFEIAYSGIGLTYTAMTYKDQANMAYSANALGIAFTFSLPNK